MPPTRDVRVNVLGPVELLIDGVAAPLPERSVLTRLLTLLALGPEKGISARVLLSEIWRDRRAEKPEVSLQQAVTRLRRKGLERPYLPDEDDGWYRLALPADRVDARRLVATAARLGTGDPPGDEELAEVLALWRGDPTADNGLTAAYGNPLREARRRLEAEQARRHKPRLLILDDKVGSKIASILGDYRCTVKTTVEDFWDLEPRCEELFDAILVDLHLREGDCGAEGLSVLAALRRSSVPAILMTYRPREGSTDAVIQRYNLLGFYLKGANTEDAEFTGLRELVDDLVGRDAKAILLPRLDEELARRERKAGKLIDLTRQGSVAKSAMQREVDAIRRVIRQGGPLPAARLAMADFNDRWLPQER